MAADSPLPLPRATAPRRWPVALLVALLTGIGGAALALPIADWATELLDVSNFEGSRSVGVVCIWMPLAFIVGLIVGFGASLSMKGRGFGGFAKRQAVSWLIMAVLISAGAGLAYLDADHAPSIDGRTLALAIELRVPTNGRTAMELQKNGFCAYLFTEASHRQNTGEIQWSDSTQTQEFITLPMWAPVNSRNVPRIITTNMEGEAEQRFDVKLPQSPTTVDAAWTEWLPMKSGDGTEPPPSNQCFVRYKVRFSVEHSGTPADSSPDE